MGSAMSSSSPSTPVSTSRVSVQTVSSQGNSPRLKESASTVSLKESTSNSGQVVPAEEDKCDWELDSSVDREFCEALKEEERDELEKRRRLKALSDASTEGKKQAKKGEF